MLHVRHAVAAGRAGDWWRFDVVRKVVFMVLRHGTVAIDVCSPKKPRYGAYPITRVDGDTWQTAPARYTSRVSDELTAETREISELVGVTFVQLLDAPDDVSTDLTNLGRNA